MKSMLYVGASLMIGASIYGFVNYSQNQEKKGFTEMYKEVGHTPASVDPPVVEEKKEVVPAADVKTVAKRTRSKKVVPEKEEPAIVAIPEEETLTPTTINITDLTSEIETKPEVNVKKKKKLNHKIFSRAPLREEIEMEKTPKVKKEEAKNDKS